jgi:hypothetical protein
MIALTSPRMGRFRIHISKKLSKNSQSDSQCDLHQAKAFLGRTPHRCCLLLRPWTNDGCLPRVLEKLCCFLLLPDLGGSETKSALYSWGCSWCCRCICFILCLGCWILSNPLLEEALSGGQSSGGYCHYQPDLRIFPNKKNRDGKQDIDRSNDGHPFSQLI